eukprot:TCONS_00007337-protein
MSWLKTRRRSVDISKKQLSNGTDLSPGNQVGRYQYKETTSSNSTNEEEKYMNGVLSSEMDHDFEKLSDLKITDETQVVNPSLDDQDFVDNEEKRVVNNVDKNDSLGEQSEGSENQEISSEENTQDHRCVESEPENESGVTLDSESDICCSTIENESENDEERAELRDYYSDENMNKITTASYRRNLHRQRHSLDSQLELLPNYHPSLGYLNEEDDGNISDDSGVVKDEPKPPQKKKSISWASDLETIHEFQKIKGRRLSLSSLFKKY